jgi:L,D-transpeptidase YcbB
MNAFTASVPKFRAIASLFFVAAVISSCQRNLTKTENSETVAPADGVPARPERHVKIDTLQQRIADRIPACGADERIMAKVKRFYIANSLMTKWLQEDKPGLVFLEFTEQVKSCANLGLQAADYNIESIGERVTALYSTRPIDVARLADLDIEITQTFFLFVSHLQFGKIRQAVSEKNVWIHHPKKDDGRDVHLLLESMNAPQLAGSINELQPSAEQYWKLQKALIYYRGEKKSNTAISLATAAEKIHPGARHRMMPLIRSTLASITPATELLNNTTGQPADSILYDEDLVTAIKEFQRIHGLVDDGIIGGNTLKFLNQSPGQKADVIALNMERLRWSDNNRGDHYITVNIPEYKLRIIEQQNQTLEMDVIVGAINTKTPVFQDTLEYLVLSPTWTVPPSIMKNEIFPRLKRNPGFYACRKSYLFYKNGVEVDPSSITWDHAVDVHEFRVVQKPGYDNALGLAKFVMPNTMNIYLHDTPDHSLFSKSYKALSHGCVRLSDPARLAEYLLAGEHSWDLASIRKAMGSHRPTRVILQKQYPVYLEYYTAWVDENGQVNFREDIYGHDKRQELMMKQVLPTATAIVTR